MLEKVRKPTQVLNLKNIVAYFIFGAIILVFVGFGMSPSRMGLASGGVAAVVNRVPISLADYRDRLQMAERQYQMRAEQLPESQRQEFNKSLRNKVLDDLIVYEVVYQGAVEKGVGASDEEIADFILGIPAFQEEGQFRRDRYDQYLKGNRLTAAQFEDKVRRDLVVRKLQTLFQDALKPTAVEREKDHLVEETKVDLSVAAFGSEELEQKLQVTPKEITDFLASPESLARVKKVYDENPAQFTQAEQVRARHILIRFDKTKKDYDAEALKQIKEIAEKAKNGDFAKLASQFSEDPGSKAKGGDLGFFGKGRMVPEFETAAFALQAGQVSPIVKTEYGYHLIKTEEKKPAKTFTFDEVKSDLAKTEIAKGKMDPFVTDLEAKVKAGDQASVEKTLKDLGMGFKETGEFNLASGTVPQFGENEKLIEAVSRNGTQKGMIKELIKSSGKYFIVQLKSIRIPNSAAAKEDPMADTFSSRKYMDAFNNWTRAEHAHASIQRNNQMVAN